MKEKFIKFMEGRYGVDGFARFTMGVALVCIVASVFFRNGSTTGAILNTVGLAAIIYTYFRMLSRNIQKRYAENQKYLSMTAKIRQWFRKEKNMMEQRKHIIFIPVPAADRKSGSPGEKEKLRSTVRSVIQNLSKKAEKPEDKQEELCLGML